MKGATAFTVGARPVAFTTSALIAGEGIDLVVKRRDKQPFTVQLTVEQAKALAEALNASADESLTL